MRIFLKVILKMVCGERLILWKVISTPRKTKARKTFLKMDNGWFSQVVISRADWAAVIFIFLFIQGEVGVNRKTSAIISIANFGNQHPAFRPTSATCILRAACLAESEAPI